MVQTTLHIVNKCPLTLFYGGALQRHYLADDDTIKLAEQMAMKISTK